MSASKPAPEPNFVMVAPDSATASVERLRRQALRLLGESPDEEADATARAARAPEDGRDRGAVSPTSSMIAGVIAMPAAFLAVVFGAIALFGKPGAAPAAAPGFEQLAQPAPARATGPTFASATNDARGIITLAEDARIASIALDADRIALSIESPAGREILIYDFRQGRQIGAAQIETIRTQAVDTLGMLTGPPPALAAPAAEAGPADAPRIKPRQAP